MAMNKNLWIGVIVLIVLVGLGYYLVNKKPQMSSDTITIGAALGLTGFCDTWGTDEQKAIQLALDEANANGGVDGKTIVLKVEDMQCEAKGAVSSVQKLISVDHVEALIGPTWGDSFQGAFPLINDSKIVSVSPSAAMEALELNQVKADYVFSTWFPQRAEVDALQTEMQKRGVKKVVMLHDQDAFGLVLMSLFKEGAAAHGITIAKEEGFPVGYDDFRTTITELKSIKPDAVFASFLNPPTKGKFLKQAYENSLPTQLYSSTDIQDQSLLDQFGSVLDGVIYSAPEASGDYDDFAKRFMAKYGTAPVGPSVTNAYDATNVIIAALKDHYENGTDMTAATQQVNIHGVTVKQVRFNSAHQITDVKFEIKTIKNGKFVSAD